MFLKAYAPIMICAFFGVSLATQASLDQAAKALNSRGDQSTKLRSLVINLSNSGYYFAAIPWMKDYLVAGNKTLDPTLEKAFERIVAHAGSAVFETLPSRILRKNNSDTASYLLAKKNLRAKNFSQVLRDVSGVNPNHPIAPFASHVKASALANAGDDKRAAEAYRECQRVSQSFEGKEDDDFVAEKMRLNGEYCLLGEARSLFGSADHLASELKYLDISKTSPVWPEILIEEAWASYYLKNYNRTLGKLVTYNAPLFRGIVNPEIEILKALAYLKLCLYEDARGISDGFYKNYLNSAKRLRSKLRSNRNHKYYYRMMMDYESLKKADSPFLKDLLESIARENNYRHVRTSLIHAAQELERAQKEAPSSIRGTLVGNLREVVQNYKDVMGGKVRARLVELYADFYRAFEGMSYINLEVLKQKKERLYEFSQEGKKRGDVKYIERNDKQYFWNFNGEFWADELGDYVFGLGSQC